MLCIIISYIYVQKKCLILQIVSKKFISTDKLIYNYTYTLRQKEIYKKFFTISILETFFI